MISINLNETPFGKIIAVAFLIVGLVVAPGWFIFQFSRPIFIQLDVIKILFISIAVGAPILIFNCIVEKIRPRKKSSEKSSKLDLDTLAAASINTMTILYVPCIISFNHTTTFSESVAHAISMQVVILIGNIITFIFERRKRTIPNQAAASSPSPADPVPQLSSSSGETGDV